MNENSEAQPCRTMGTWIAIFLSLPLIALGLFSSLTCGEQVYGFIVEVNPKYTAAQWGLIIACRVASWLILLACVIQIGLIASRFWSTRKRNNRALWITLLLLFGLVIFWGYFMLPSVALLHAVQRDAADQPPTAPSQIP
jgi:cytochrome bd-type quinol oxidase subunit 2